MTKILPFPGQARGFELHGVRRTPGAPCLKCGARSLTGSEMCFAHATTEERGAQADVDPIEGERFDADSYLSTDSEREVA